MADEIKVYGFCETKCRREVMAKEKVEELVKAVDDKVDKNFILVNQQELVFTDKVATISDARITVDSLADVYFTSDTISVAEKAIIAVETIDGAVTLTATKEPEGTIKATIHIRVV